MVGLLRTSLLNYVVDLMYPLCCVVLKIKKSWILNPCTLPGYRCDITEVMSHEMTSPTTLQPIENCAPGIHWLHFRINFGYNIFVVRNDSPILGFCFYFISNTIATVITLDISKQWSCHTLEFKNNDFITINNENDYQLVMLGMFFFLSICVSFVLILCAIVKPVQLMWESIAYVRYCQKDIIKWTLKSFVYCLNDINMMKGT